MKTRWVLTVHHSYPVYSFLLPVYSFWCMDDFGWGNTRLVIGEGNSKKVIMNEDDKFDESMIPLKKFSGMASALGAPDLTCLRFLQSTKPRHGKLVRITLRRPTARGLANLEPMHGLVESHRTAISTLRNPATTTVIRM
jgi:hypothetical protein